MSLVRLAQQQLASRGMWTGPFKVDESSWAAINAQIFGDGLKTDAGIVVTPETALTFSAVFDAVNQISGDVAKLPLNLHKRRPGGGSDVYVESKLHWLVKHEPNPEMGSVVFRRTLVAHALTWHGGFAEIERDGLGRPAALWLITPDRVEVTRRKINGRPEGSLVYVVSNGDGVSEEIEPRNMIHLQGLGWSGHGGYRVLNLARQAIGLALAMERFGSAFFGNNSAFGGVLTAPETMDAEEKKDLRHELESVHKSAERAFKFLLLDGGLTYTSIGVEPEKSQLNASRDKQIEEVARFFNIPLHKVKSLERATNNNIEQQDLEYYKGCLLTWLTLLEEECNRKLVSSLERRQQYFKHNANAFLRGDIKSRYDALGVARDRGIINADEWRDLEDMNPQDGGQGQLYLVQGAQVPLSRIDEMTQAQIAKLTAPPPAPTSGGGTSDEDRAKRAEAAATQALEAATAERDARQAAEASASATREEIAVLREREQRAVEQAATLDLLATELRAEVTRRQEAETAALVAKAEAEGRAVSAEDRARQADEARTEAIAHAAQAVLKLTESSEASAADVQAARVAVAQAQASEAAALTELATIRATVERAEGEVARLSTTLEAVQQDADAAMRAAHEAQAQAETLAREKVASEDVRTVHEAAVLAAEAKAEQAIADAERARARAEAVEAEMLAASDRVSLLDAERQQQAASAEQARAQVAALDARLTAERQAHTEHRTAEMVQRRDLLLAEVERLVRREVSQARQKQATPEKLRRWLSGFATVHEPHCLEALTRHVRAHLVAMGSKADPVETTTELVRAHIAAFSAQVRIALEADPDDYQAVLDRVLTRWESDRAHVVADQVMAEEIRHVQS